MSRFQGRCRESITVGLSNICYTVTQKIEQGIFRRFPTQWSHRKVIVFPIMYLQLILKICERIKSVCGIEILIVLSMRALYFSVMSWRIRSDFSVPDTQRCQFFFKHGQFRVGFIAAKALRKFSAIICLYTFYRKRKGSEHVFQKDSGRIRGNLPESFHIAESGKFIDCRVLIELFPGCISCDANRRNVFHVDLYTLSGGGHLFIRLWNIFGICRLLRSQFQSFQSTPESGDRTGIAPLFEFYPKDDQTGMRIASAHILDQFDLVRSVLIWMGMRTSGTIAKRVPGAVITFFPSVNILAIGFVFTCSLGNTMFFSVVNEG